jgi:predicted DNA-binding protein with PD1-like motif
MIVSRLKPGKDLKNCLENLRDENQLKSGIILCIVGSLNKAVLRMSNETEKIFTGPLEIVSAEGTISTEGIHVHIAVSDVEGSMYGGHLMEGCSVHTTAEICILRSKMIFKRIFDAETGYKELVIEDDSV